FGNEIGGTGGVNGFAPSSGLTFGSGITGGAIGFTSSFFGGNTSGNTGSGFGATPGAIGGVGNGTWNNGGTPWPGGFISIGAPPRNVRQLQPIDCGLGEIISAWRFERRRRNNLLAVGTLRQPMNLHARGLSEKHLRALCGEHRPDRRVGGKLRSSDAAGAFA